MVINLVVRINWGLKCKVCKLMKMKMYIRVGVFR